METKHTPTPFVEVRRYTGTRRGNAKGSQIAIDTAPIVSGLSGNLTLRVGRERGAEVRLYFNTICARQTAERMIAECDRQDALAKAHGEE